MTDKPNRLYITDIAIPNHDDLHASTDAPGVVAPLRGQLGPVRCNGTVEASVELGLSLPCGLASRDMPLMWRVGSSSYPSICGFTQASAVLSTRLAMPCFHLLSAQVGARH